MNRPQGRMTDLVGGMAVMGLGVVVAIVAVGYPELPSDRPGPGFFPMILGGCLAILGGSLIIQYLIKPASDDGDGGKLRSAGVINGLLVLAAPFAYILMAPLVGSRIVLGGICLALMLRLGVRPIKAVPISVVTALVMVLLFVDVLGVRLP